MCSQSAGELGVGADHVLAHVLGVRARVADPLDPVDRVDASEQLGEAGLALPRQVAPVGVDVLAQQGDLADAVRGERLDLGDQLDRVTALLAPAGRGHDAVRAAAVAALRDLQPGLELALALHRQVAGEVLEVEVPLGGDRVGGEELGQAADLPRAEGDVDEREALEHLVLHRLGPAAADADDPLGVLGLEPLRLPQMGDEAAVGRLADRAGVEEDQIGLVALGRGARSRATRAFPSSAPNRARSSDTRRWSRGSACRSPRES